MSLTITTPAPSRLLTTVQRVKDLIPVTVSTDDALILDLIRRASDAIDSYCNREFARQVYVQLDGAYGGIGFLCAESPVIVLGTVTFNGNPVTDVTIQEAGQGLLYRRLGFDWTAQTFPGLTATGWNQFGGGFLNFGNPIPLQEEPLWSVAFTAGFILPSQNILDSATVSAAAADNSFNDSASLFPPLSKAGDIVETSGWTTAGNNGRWTIVSATTSKIVVSGGVTLTTEAAGAGTRDILFQTLPYDVEQACLETVKSAYSSRGTDSAIVEKQMGVARLRYSESGGGADGFGLPPIATALLRRWTR